MTKHLLHARLWAKYFSCIISFAPHSQPFEKVLLALFTDRETEVQRSKAAPPEESEFSKISTHDSKLGLSTPLQSLVYKPQEFCCIGAAPVLLFT